MSAESLDTAIGLIRGDVLADVIYDDFTDAANDCTVQSVDSYDDGLYVGLIGRYSNCAGAPTEAVVIGANDKDETMEVLVEVQFINGIDEGIVAEITNTFMVR